MNGEPTDAQIMRASHEDPPAFGAIFDRHAGGVHRYLQRRVGLERADDLLGEVFRLAFEARGGYRAGAESAFPWLLGIAANAIAKSHHRQGRYRRALGRLALQTEALAADPMIESSAERLDAAHGSARVMQALMRLSRGEREALLLVAWEELTYEEAAAALGIPVGTVRSRLNRARRRLRADLDDDAEHPRPAPILGEESP